MILSDLSFCLQRTDHAMIASGTHTHIHTPHTSRNVNWVLKIYTQMYIFKLQSFLVFESKMTLILQ